MHVPRNPAAAISLTLGSLLACVSLVWSGCSPAWAADRPFLIETHTAAGLKCEACHAENPPKTAADMAVCINCHGKYEAIAEKTQKVRPHNPHESHQGEVECGECHHVHKASVDFCGQCHQFGFKVP